jgi:hypothetical protein
MGRVCLLAALFLASWLFRRLSTVLRGQCLDKPPPCPENHPHLEPKHHPTGFSGAGWQPGRERKVL